MKKSSALARFGSAVRDLFKCRKTKVSNDFKYNDAEPGAGSNVSKIPTLFEIPKINNLAVFVSSNTKKDSKPIKN